MAGDGNSQIREIEWLSGIRAFRPMSRAQIRALAARTSFSEFERRQLICRPDVNSAEVRVLLSGLAGLVMLNSDGKQSLIALISRGFLFKLPQLRRFVELRQLRGEFEVRLRWEAISRSRVGVIRLNEFLKVLSSDNPASSHSVLSELFGGAASLLGRYFGFFGLHLRHRIALALIELSEEIGTRDARGSLLMMNLPARLIADLTGSSRPKVSLVLSEFKRKGMVIHDGSRMIVNARKLHAVLSARA